MEAVSAVLPEVGRGAEVSWEVMKTSLILNSVPERKEKEREKNKWGLRQGGRHCQP